MVSPKFRVTGKSAYLDDIKIGQLNKPVPEDSVQSVDITPSTIRSSIELADTKSERFGVPSFSFFLHQIISILMSIVLSCDVEPYLKGKQYDLLFKNIFIDISTYSRIYKYSGSPDYVLVLDKYTLASFFGIPESIVRMSLRDDKHIINHKQLSSDGQIKGTYSQPRYMDDEDFLRSVAPILKQQLILSLKEESKVPSFDDFTPQKPDLRGEFSSFITRVPYNYITRIVDDKMEKYKYRESEIKEDQEEDSNLDLEFQPFVNFNYFSNFVETNRGPIKDWAEFNEADLEISRSSDSLDSICARNLRWITRIESNSNGYDDFMLLNPPTVGASIDKGIWSLKDPVNQDIYKSSSRRYDLVNESEYNILSKQYLEDVKKYCENRKKDYLKVCQKNYGNNINEIIDPSIKKYKIKDWQREIFTKSPLNVDDELFALIGKTMPEKTLPFLLMTYDSLRSSTVFQEALFMRQICESIVLQKKNTKHKRMIVKHKQLHLACSISIVGNMTSNDTDAGFAHIRFHYQLRDPSIEHPGFSIHPAVVSDATYNSISQGFKIRKPDVAWFLSLPEKMIAMTYSMLEERGSLDIVRNIAEIQHMKYITLCNLSIMNRASWRISKILKPYKYYIVNLSQKSPFTKQAETKFLTEFELCNGSSKLPEFTYILYFLYKNIHNPEFEELSPVFRLPLDMMGSEAYIMNLCPKMLYGRKRHLVSCYKNISEETDLYYTSLSHIESVRNHAEYVYKSWTYTPSDNELMIEHINIINASSTMTDGRFIYSPLSQSLILEEIRIMYKDIPNMGSIHHPSFSSLISTKGAFSTYSNENCKAIEGLAQLSADLPADMPTTTLSAASMILSEEMTSHSTPLLYAIVPKDQVGGDREISMMNEKFRILQSICESVSREFGIQSGVDKLADKDKDSHFYRTALLEGKTFAFMGDQTRWGPNFNTAIFGDMFHMFRLAGFPCTFIPETVCYMSQRKIFLCPKDIDLNKITNKMHSIYPQFPGIHAPAHMGEGIFHYTSSLFHSIVASSFCRILKDHMDLSIHNIYPMVTSDDITIIHKHVEERDISKLNNSYLNIQSYLLPFSIKTSAYKNITSRDYIEFNSMAVFQSTGKYMSQSLKQMVGNVSVPTSHTFWNDLMFANSTFNTLLNSGCSFSQSYLAYLLNTSLAFRRWGMTRLFYKVGYFRILKMEELIQNVSLFNRDYTVYKDDHEIRIQRSSDSVSVFKFRTYERLTKCWYTFRDFSEKLKLLSSSRIFTLKNSPESNATPVSKFILPTSFKEKATVRVGDLPTLKIFLKDHAVEDSRASMELAAVISARSGNWAGSTFKGLSLEDIHVPDLEKSPEVFLSNLMTYLTMSLRVDTKILPHNLTLTSNEICTSIHKMRRRVVPSLDVESLMVTNFGSYHLNPAGHKHYQILSRSGSCHRLSTSLHKAISAFFDTYEDKYTFLSTLCQVLEESLNKSSMRVLGLYKKGTKNPLTYNFIKNNVMNLSMVKSSISIPMSLIFETPLMSFELNSLYSGTVVSSKSKIHALVKGKHNTVEISDFNLTVDHGLYITKDNMGVNFVYVKPLPPRFLSMNELCCQVEWHETPHEDLKIIVLNSETIMPEKVVIHTQRFDTVSRSAMMDLFNQIQEGDLDSVTKALIINNDYDSHLSSVSFKKEEQPESKLPDMGDEWEGMADFLENISKGTGADVQLQTSVVEIDDRDIKALITCCRDGYYLKRAAQRWLMSQENRLYRHQYVSELGSQAITFPSNFIMQTYSEVDTQRGLKMPDSLLTLVSQIFESNPVSDIVFYRSGNKLYLNVAAIKLAVIARDMLLSKDKHINDLASLPLFSLCRSYGNSL